MNLIYIKDVIIFSWGQATAGLFYFCYMLIAARTLGVSDFGLFQALMGIYGILGAFGSPINIATIHCVANSNDEIKACALGVWLRISFLIGGGSALIIIIFSAQLSNILSSKTILPFILAGLLLFATTVLTTFYGGLQGRNNYSAFSIAKIIESLIALGCGSILMLVGTGVSGAVSGHLGGMTALSVFFLTRKKLFSLQRNSYSIRNDLQGIAKPLAVFGTLLFVSNWPAIIARIRLTEELAGLYGALFSLRNLTLPFAFAATLPLYSRTISKNDEPKMFIKAIVFVIIVGSIFPLIGIICPKLFFRTLYGVNFIKASIYMVQFGFALVLHMISMVVMFRYATKESFRFCVLWLPILIISLLLFLPDLSITKIIITQIIAWSIYLLSSFLLNNGRKFISRYDEN